MFRSPQIENSFSQSRKFCSIFFPFLLRESMSSSSGWFLMGRKNYQIEIVNCYNKNKQTNEQTKWIKRDHRFSIRHYLNEFCCGHFESDRRQRRRIIPNLFENCAWRWSLLGVFATDFYLRSAFWSIKRRIFVVCVCVWCWSVVEKFSISPLFHFSTFLL